MAGKTHTPHDKKVWTNFRQHFITKYECLLAEGEGTMLDQDEYGGTYHMADTLEANSPITKIIVKYVEQATSAETKVSNLEQRMRN